MSHQRSQVHEAFFPKSLQSSGERGGRDLLLAHHFTAVFDDDALLLADARNGFIEFDDVFELALSQNIIRKIDNNKIEISKFDAKLQKLETEIKSKADKDSKGMFAEILETRKEIRDIKEEFEHGKEDIQKIIEIMTLNNKNKD